MYVQEISGHTWYFFLLVRILARQEISFDILKYYIKRNVTKGTIEGINLVCSFSVLFPLVPYVSLGGKFYDQPTEDENIRYLNTIDQLFLET